MEKKEKKSQPYYGPLFLRKKDLYCPRLTCFYSHWIILLLHSEGPGSDLHIHSTDPWRQQQGPHQTQSRKEMSLILAFSGYPHFLAHTGCIPFIKPQADGKPLLWTLGLLDMRFQVQKSELSQGHQSRTASDHPWTLSVSQSFHLLLFFTLALQNLSN